MNSGDTLSVFVSLGLVFVSIVYFLNTEKNIKKINHWKDVCDFLGNFPRWYQFYNSFEENRQKLANINNSLHQRLIDVKNEVEDKEFQTGRRRNKEVDYWLHSTATKCNEVETLLHEMISEIHHFGMFIQVSWLGYMAEKKINEVDDLYVSGHFEKVLSRGKDTLTIVTTPFVGNAAQQNIKRILEWLNNGVTKIGVYGIKGIGKTELVEHVHNQLSRNFDVYRIKVLEEYREYDLQREIAKELRIHLEEEDGPKRAAVLYKALKRKNFVLILDGVWKYFSEEVVGIPLDRARGKMIITSRSRVVCEKLGCYNNMIAVNSLPNTEALILFKQEVHVELCNESDKEMIAKKIVAQCWGVPFKIKEMASKLEGKEELNLWQETLGRMLMDSFQIV